MMTNSTLFSILYLKPSQKSNMKQTDTFDIHQKCLFCQLSNARLYAALLFRLFNPFWRMIFA